MVTNNIRNILRQLETLADGWAMAGEIPAIERDLALEKLRALYDVLLKPSGGAPAVVEPEQEFEPVSINIDDVLSVDGDDPFAESESVSVVQAALGGQPEAVAEPVSTAQPVPVVEPEPVVEPMRTAEPEVASEAQSEPISAAQPEPDAEPMPVAQSEPEIEVLPEPEPAVQSELVTEPALVEREIEILPEPEPTSAVQPEAEVEVLSESESESEIEILPESVVESMSAVQREPVAQPRSAAPKSQPEAPAPSLFGADESEELFRHRHKREVLMSLYDIEDTAPASLRRGSAAEPQTEPASEPQVKTRPEQPKQPEQPKHSEQPERPNHSEQQAAGREPVFEPHPVSIPQPLVEPEEEDDLVIEEIDFSVEEEAPAQQTVPEDAAEPRFTISRVGREEYEPEAASAKRDTPAEKGGVLGDVLNPHKQTLADSLASSHTADGRADDLRKMIGLNDRFLLIRDLFEGDAAACDRTIGELNAFSDLDDCMIYIAENHTWNPNSDGAKLLMELLQRKLS